MKSLSIIIPAYNESARLGKTLERIAEYLKDKPFEHEIIVVDDGSTDHTKEVAERYGVLVLREEKNRGKGAAVKKGMLKARHAWRLLTDADLATPIESLDDLIEKGEGADIMIGSRALKDSHIKEHQEAYREWGGKLINAAVRTSLLSDFYDTQCGFKLFSAKAAEEIFPLQTINRFGFDIEVLFIGKKKGFKIRELPVAWSHQAGTKVKPLKDGLVILSNLFKIRFNDWAGRYKSKLA